MSGVRQEGILLVDDVGTSGGGAAVDITGPLGPNTAADSVSVTIATDQLPLPVDATITFPPSMVVTATDLDIRDLVFATDKVDVSNSLIAIDDSVPIDVNIVSGGSGGGTVDQGTPNTVTNGWPIKITDGTDTAEVVSSNDTITLANKGLLTQSIIQLDNGSGGVDNWVASPQYNVFGSNPYPWVKTMRSTNLDGDTTLNALNAQINIDIRERNYESLVIYIRNSNLIGTIKFLTNPGDGGSPLQIYNVVTAQWVLGELINPTVNTMYMVPIAGLANLYLRVTAYTSGSAVATYSAGPGVGATYANVSGSHVKITDGTDVADVVGNATSTPSAKGLLIAGSDNSAGVQYLLPILNNGFAQPTGNSYAVATDLRSTTMLDGSALARNETLITGGLGFNAGGTLSNQKLVLGDGNTLAINPVNTFGLQTRECGHSFAKSGNISLVGSRFTISSRYVVKTAAIFKCTSASFVGTIRPVVSVDNGTNWAYCESINIETGAAASTYVDSAITGAFAIPYGNGATDYGFEITARTSGSVTIFVSANSNGINSIFTRTRTLEFATDSVNTSGSTVHVSDIGGDVADVITITTPPVGTDKGLVTNSLIYGKTTGGGGTYVDVKVSPSGALQAEVTATNLDVRDLVFATDKVDVSGSSITTSGTATVSGTVAISNFPVTQPVSGSVSVSNFPATQPVSGSVTVSGSVSVSNFLATQPVSATNLDIRDLIFATDKVDVSGSTLIVSNFPAVQDVAAINLDIRDLLFASDAVNVSGSSVSISNFPATQPISGSISVSNFPATQPVSATDLDIRNLTFAQDKVDVSGSSITTSGTATVSGTVTANPTNSGTATQTQVPDSATSVTILASNSSRLGATVINTSTVTLYLRLSSSAATTGNYTVALVSGAYYEVPFRYTGAITGIWISDPNTGNANVTEFTV